MFIARPMLCDPPMCTLAELQDGTYSIDDLMMMHDIIDLKIHLNKQSNK